MTTQPTTGPTAADTTTSARETLHHLAHLTADPYIPEVHDDDHREREFCRVCPGGYQDTIADYIGDHCPAEFPAGADAAAEQIMTELVTPLLAEVDRLRAELSKADRLWRERETENGKLFDKLMAAENGRDTLRERVAELDAELEGRPSRADTLREAATAVEALDRRKTTIHADTIRDAWEEGRDEGATLLRRMAAAAPAGAEDGDRRA